MEENKEKTFTRDYAIDILRVFGIFLIVLAHTSITSLAETQILFNVRMFDVPLLVFISGLSFYKSSKKISSWKEYFSYVIKRVKRLLIPTWIFITCYLLYIWALSSTFSINYLNGEYALLSYIFFGGVDYGWIVRVLFTMALIAPFIRRLFEKINNDYIIIVLILVLYVANTTLTHFSVNFTGMLANVINTAVVPVMAYTIIYALAIGWSRFTKLGKIMAFTMFLAIMITEFSCLQTFNIRIYKYPPHLLYLSYGIVISLVLYTITSLLTKKMKKLPFTISWLSKNSFNIYFTHTFICFIFDNTKFLYEYWYLQYFITLVGAIILTILLLYFKKLVIFLFYKLTKREKSNNN